MKKKYDTTWKIEIKIKLRARIICSGRWTDVSMCSRYAGTVYTRVYEIPDERSPWTFHTHSHPRNTYATAKGPAHARKGNEAWFQLSDITLLAGSIICSVIAIVVKKKGSIIGNERTRVIFARSTRFSISSSMARYRYSFQNIILRFWSFYCLLLYYCYKRIAIFYNNVFSIIF